jgi:DNA-binding response OmpR family regulator
MVGLLAVGDELAPLVAAGDTLVAQAVLDGRQVVCTPGEFEILAAMAAEPERVFTRRQLLALTRGFDRYITERTIDVHILNLRKKIEAVPRRPAYLQTVYGVGYKLMDGTRAR